MEIISDLKTSVFYKIVKGVCVFLCIGALAFSLLYAFGPSNSFYEELFNISESEDTAYLETTTVGGCYGTNRM